MQKLSKRKTYTPTNTSLVRGNCDSQLNKDESLSVASSKTSDNNLEVNLHQHTGGLKDKVYVMSIEGNPLMPCSKTKARHLIESGKANVLGKYPFKIQLTFECENKVQEITLGIDAGYKKIGFSAVSKKEELISGALKLENGMSNRITEKHLYRHKRRINLWYRKSRFLNRKNMSGKFPPSTERRINTHIELVNRICKMLPINKIDVEGANFDIQKIANPDIRGNGYQQGNLYEYENTKAFILVREDGKCQLCGEGYNKNGWHLHHIIKRGYGSDRSENLALLHKKCHTKLHKKKLFNKLQKPKQYRAEIFMNTARLKIIDRLKKIYFNVNLAYGYKTKVQRISQELIKSHTNDAFIIAGGTTQDRTVEYVLEQRKRNNRAIQCNRNGYKPSIRRKRYVIQSGDLFWVNNIQYISKGMHSYGRYILYGDIKNKEYFKIEKVVKYFNKSMWQFIPKS